MKSEGSTPCDGPQKQKIAAHAAARCLAKTRRGLACQQAAVRGKRRCRMHGGAVGSGAPAGNRNRYVHGRYSAASIALRRLISAMVRNARDMVA